MKPSIMFIYIFAATVSAKWWAREEPSCAVLSRSAEGIAYRYYAQGTPKEPCATSDDHERIRASLDHSMKKLDLDCLPESTCMPVDHDCEWNGGAWRGYLLYGPKDKVDLNKSCGSEDEFDSKYGGLSLERELEPLFSKSCKSCKSDSEL
ncbi:unnamed protein product [Aureobasidium vineae]|uniref:Secreted protein CSS2 C-terminal domain-containing protein n=1 Tax=Aureobasidium vineae TaxID=2773715 RepID=A0A9N8JWV3_9PEZI|nr:unnamed protein product [Aureobasidium vineae]